MPLPLFLLNCSLLQTQQKCSVRFSRGNSWHWSFKILLFSSSVVSDSLWPHESQHARLPCPSPSPGVCSNSCPLSQWFHPTSSSSVSPSPPTLSLSQNQSFPVSQLFTSGGQGIGASALAPVFPVNIQGTGIVKFIETGNGLGVNVT